jgi:RNA 2',3'-cyclic 3'-phosphodiesterase
MRLFIGVELSEVVKDGAMQIAEDLREQFARIAPSAVLRWVPPANLHITLWFLGEVDDARASLLRESLALPLATRAFELRGVGAGMFPPSGPPRALWVGLIEGAASLVTVYNELTPRLVRLGFTAERRPYSPHLTIARFKDIGREDIAAVRQVAAQSTADAGSCRVQAVTLFRSRLSPPASAKATAGRRSFSEGGRGAQYEPLLRVPLI